MKVLLVVEPGVDGVFRHVDGLCRFLFTRDVSVHLAYSSVRHSRHLDELVDAVRARGGQTLDMRTGNAPHPRDATAYAKLRGLARAVRPDVIHAHSSKAGVLARTMAVTGVRADYFYTPHAYYGLGNARTPRTMFFNSVERVLGGVGETINISPDEAHFATGALKVPEHRIHVIHNPVDTAVFRPPAQGERASLRRQFGIPPEALLVGSVGRLAAQKDPVTAYRALADAMAVDERLWFCQVGRGEMDHELAHLAAELAMTARMTSIPYLESPAEIYRAFDALILTSRYEAGWPLVVLEAMATELPVIVAEAPGTSEISRGGLSHCWTARPGDVEGFGRAIKQWMADIENHRPVNHRTIAEEQFGVEVLFGEVLDCYRRGPGSGRQTSVGR